MIRRSISRLAFLFLLPVVFPLCLGAQESEEEPEDSLVRLLSGKSAQLLEIDGMNYRKIVGPARFFHNNTYLLCDTALWNVDSWITIPRTAWRYFSAADPCATRTAR